MKKIILATDFSKGASKAEEMAIAIAKKHISNIILLYCFTPTYVDPTMPGGMVIVLDEGKEKQLEDKLSRKARSIQEQGVRTTFRLSTGSVSDGIKTLVEEEAADFAILGKTGASGFLDKILGSTAEYVINNIKIPLLVVPENTKSIDVDRIQYATELEYDENEILEEVFEIARKLKAEVDFVNVLSDKKLDLVDNAKLIDDMKKSFPNERLNIQSIRSNSVEKAILELSESKENTALVVASHHRGFLEGLLKPSVSKSLIARTNVPTFVFHFE
ncbi:universal stress protein [uncultured Arcticibacterium sp.]|uniref:universal stress protein n=1 Tax=uncultured Arcticibacterium sp. TaxID=2173042 RepID=UPI0030FA592B